jgi:NAD(P)-dependent dehydrogenase (short-subunit alcohol dehydrogenase family)
MKESNMTKTVLITGTSSGIGKASVLHFAAAGWNVVATLRRPAAAPADFAGLPNVLVTPLDVQVPETISAAIAAGIDRFGQIDSLVNNAGFSLFGVFEAMAPQKIQEQFDVNLFGVMAVTRAILPHFRQRKGGQVINVSSGAGVFTLPMLSLYCASKFALEGFSEALAYELAAQNIAVKIVEPHGGVAQTDFSTRMGAEFAAADAGMAGDYADFIATTSAAFERMRGQRMMTAAEVAAVIFTAASDGTPKLRYPVGDDARGFMAARRLQGDDGYVAFMRGTFPAPPMG